MKAIKMRYAVICKGNYVGRTYTNKKEAIKYARTFPLPATVITDLSSNWGTIVYENDAQKAENNRA